MGIISAISAGLDILKGLLGMASDKEKRNEGAVAQDDATKAATLNTLKNVSAPVSNTERDQLWDDNSKKFGPSSK